MTNPLGNFGFKNAPIGIEGVQSYVDMMNAQHPDAPYVWRVGSRSNSEGQSVRCVEVIRKSDLRHQGPRVSSKEARRLLSNLKLIEGGRED